MLETLARIRLAQDSLDECARILDQIEGNATTPDDRLLWAQRHAALTRTKLLARQGHHRVALRQADHALNIAKQAEDSLLYRMVLLEKSHVLQRLKRLPEALDMLAFVTDLDANETPELYAQYEGCLACALVLENRPESAELHRGRSERIFTALRSKSGLIELSRRWLDVTSTIPECSFFLAHASSECVSAGSAIQAVAALVAHSGRPALVAQALVELLSSAGCVSRVAITTGVGRDRQTICSIGSFDGAKPESLPKRLCVGSAENSFDIWLEPQKDVESTASVNAIVTLVSTISELEQARLEREQQMRLWPIEDVDLMNEHAVISGMMRDLMTKARRVAATNITVLLTGESGTGKEIFARAIHTFSGRSMEPFVPFNCAALPRDMVESQLFGHRRGAFTGADRDNLGVIRAARGGTLFLDEIGELSIDLQPKLLRFLESNEICPLGETTPFTVDVRIVAATNARLEQAVKDGRFREDLFYRLHGVRLEIPPLRERRDELPALVHHFLARAVGEFKKGNIRIAEDTMERLLLAPWPGNIRQLQNELRRMVALAEPDAILTPASLSPDVAGAAHDPHAARDGAAPMPLHAKLNPTLEHIEREMVKAALHKHRGRMDDAAKALGISRKGLYLKRQRLGL
jgi:DNA-binding NtrC family response regulator